jgi:hypothetical protein
MKLQLLESELAVIRRQPSDPIPDWVWQASFCSVTKTDDELSIFCSVDVVPETEKATAGWRAFRVVGTIDFEIIGIISSLTMPLAAKQISVFSISTHDTDYLVVPDERLNDAIDVLQRSGHQFV